VVNFIAREVLVLILFSQEIRLEDFDDEEEFLLAGGKV
jgi:hypothetical protein